LTPPFRRRVRDIVPAAARGGAWRANR
jgi:hypothetical protein